MIDDDDVITFAVDEWPQIVRRAEQLMERSNGHEFVRVLKTRCQRCGRSPRARGKCSYWCDTLVNRILFVLMNKEQELPATPTPRETP